MKKNNKVSMVFCTCDAYSDLWDGFFKLFKKYWPEWDGEIIFNTDSLEYSCEGLDIVNIPHQEGESKAWSDMLARALKMCRNDKILLVLDDFYFMNYVDNKKWLHTVEVMDQDLSIKSITYLYELGGYQSVSPIEGFWMRKHFSLYKITAHLTLYRRDYLLSILRQGESAWDFEINGTVRSWMKGGKFLCMEKGGQPIIPYDGDFVRHGMFVEKNKRYFEEKEGIVFSDKRKSVESFNENYTSKGKFLKKMSYGLKALPSIFKQKP